MYWKSANDLIDILRKKYHHNEDATRNNYLVYYQMFYVFMWEFSLPYTTQNVRLWAEGMSGFMDEPHRMPSIKRSFYLLDIFLRNSTITDEDLEIVLCSPGKIANCLQRIENCLMISYHAAAKKTLLQPLWTCINPVRCLSCCICRKRESQ